MARTQGSYVIFSHLYLAQLSVHSEVVHGCPLQHVSVVLCRRTTRLQGASSLTYHRHSKWDEAYGGEGRSCNDAGESGDGMVAGKGGRMGKVRNRCGVGVVGRRGECGGAWVHV